MVFFVVFIIYLALAFSHVFFPFDCDFARASGLVRLAVIAWMTRFSLATYRRVVVAEVVANLEARVALSRYVFRFPVHNRLQRLREHLRRD